MTGLCLRTLTSPIHHPLARGTTIESTLATPKRLIPTSAHHLRRRKHFTDKRGILHPLPPPTPLQRSKTVCVSAIARRPRNAVSGSSATLRSCKTRRPPPLHRITYCLLFNNLTAQPARRNTRTTTCSRLEESSRRTLTLSRFILNRQQ
jgi:hypothetical protein